MIHYLEANQTSLNASDYSDAYANANICATAYTDDGNSFSYCDLTTMAFTIENPIPGVNLNQNGTTVELSGIGINGSCVSFYWDKSDLPNGMDTVSISIKADYFGLSGTQKILLQKILPDHFT